MFEPISDICCWILFFEPCPMASIVMTDATPIMMPSMVRKARSLLFANARRAILNKLVPFMFKSL